MTVASLLELDFPNIDPLAFRLWIFEVHWYGIAYLVSFICAWLMLWHASRRGYLRFAQEDVATFIMYAIAGTFLGGRLGFLIFYDDFFTSGRVFSAPLEIFGLGGETGFHGVKGLSFHGGLVGVILAGSLFCWIRASHQWRALDPKVREAEGKGALRKRWRALAAGGFDASVLIAPLGIFFVRCANFINGELYGRFVTGSDGKPVLDATQAPGWAMRFPTGPTDASTVQENAQFYHSVLERHYIEHPGSIPVDGFLEDKIRASAWKLANGLPVDEADWAMVRDSVPLRHPSQLYQALCEGLLVLIIMWMLRRHMPKRGMLAGCFLIAYAAARVPMELFRQPDSQFSAKPDAVEHNMAAWGEVLNAIHLTQGQFLCVIMALAGAAMLFLCGRSKNPHMILSPDERRFRGTPITAEEAGIPVIRKQKPAEKTP
jgi:prolipoprotein diacylglyceryl transferase